VRRGELKRHAGTLGGGPYSGSASAWSAGIVVMLLLRRFVVVSLS
jgi:hypothetical protein